MGRVATHPSSVSVEDMKERLSELKTEVRRRIEKGELTARTSERTDLVAREVQLKIAQLETKIEQAEVPSGAESVVELNREVEGLRVHVRESRRST